MAEQNDDMLYILGTMIILLGIVLGLMILTSFC